MPDPERRSHRWPIWFAASSLALFAVLALVIVLRGVERPFGLEIEWMAEIVEHRSPFWLVPAIVFDTLGGGLFAILAVPLTIAGLLLVWRRRWAALYFVLASAVSALMVQLLKALVGRPRPQDILISVDPGSFPSGHSANAAVIAITLGLILRAWWVWLAGALYTFAMMLSRTYLGAHWITDTIGGVLVAGAVALALWAALGRRVMDERAAGPAPLWRPASARRLTTRG